MAAQMGCDRLQEVFKLKGLHQFGGVIHITYLGDIAAHQHDWRGGVPGTD
jgi:hypothetical protein